MFLDLKVSIFCHIGLLKENKVKSIHPAPFSYTWYQTRTCCNHKVHIKSWLHKLSRWTLAADVLSKTEFNPGYMCMTLKQVLRFSASTWIHWRWLHFVCGSQNVEKWHFTAAPFLHRKKMFTVCFVKFCKIKTKLQCQFLVCGRNKMDYIWKPVQIKQKQFAK